MIANRMKVTLPLAVLAVAIMMLTGVSGARAAMAPVKEILSSHVGWEVDPVGKGKICTVESKDTCQPGKPSSEPGGFDYPKGVAVAANGNVYVADANNNRVQELTAAGKFVLMFGREVNANKTNVCLAGETCKAGVEGSEAGALEPLAVAVDPSSGNVYVAEPNHERVDEYTAAGQFILMIGKEVNQSTKANICTEKEIETEGVSCQAGAFSGEHGAFAFPQVLAVGPTNGLLYVGDQQRVQEFEATGKYKSEIPLGSSVSTLAVDQASDVYLVSEPNSPGSPIREYDPSGKEINVFLPPNGTVFTAAIALDPAGRLAVIESEPPVVYGEPPQRHGLLYEVGATSLRLITEFANQSERSIAFNGKDELYAVSSQPGHEVIAYKPVPVGELVATAGVVAPGECVPSAERETNATFDCSLTGEVDPWGVSETEAWFQWGRTPSLGEETAPAMHVPSVKKEGEEETPVKVSVPIDGVRPNETFYDELAGEDHYVKAPELLTSATASFTTPSVPPRILGEPSVAFVHPSSVMMFGELNPENTNTQYEFQYGPCKENNRQECPESPYTAKTTVLESPAYAEIAAALEVTGLQPATSYRYRLVAVNEKDEAAVNEAGGSVLPEGTFVTEPEPVVAARTGGVSAVTTTSAVVSGTVDPDGQASTYTFEIGVYNGADTRYGTVFSAPAGAGTAAVEERLALTGLQPGTTYAYRIAIHFGDGTISGSTATGAGLTFTTEGLPAVLVSPAPLAQMAIPPTPFPKESAKATPKSLTRAQQLANALKACAKKSKSKRAACRRSARKKYAVSKMKGKKK